MTEIAASEADAEHDVEFLAFKLGGEEYALNIQKVQDKPPPSLGAAINTEHLIGIGSVDERMLILVDIDRLMSSDELGLVERLAA